MQYHLVILCCLLRLSLGEDIHTTKVFIMPIEPSLFNWSSETPRNLFSYHPSLLNAPDLPPWMYYMYSSRHKTGYLYGVPPAKQKNLQLEIIGLNRENYETRRRVVHMNIIEKPETAQNEVQVKIDNLNVDDMFDQDKLSRFLDVFRLKLWPESAADLYVTFLASAVQLGARLPITPNEGEGVVLRLGSRAEFSAMLLDLQEEVRPLWKMGSCRGFKRTTVERILRKDGFALDWCTFRLMERPHDTQMNRQVGSSHNNMLTGSEWKNSVWVRPARKDIPCRSYLSEFALTLIFPIFIMVSLALLLSLILCFHHEGMNDETSNVFFDSVFNICEDLWRTKRNEDTPDVMMVQYEAVQRATSTLRSLSNQRNVDGTQKESPQLSAERTNGVRPSPPPYTGPKLNSRVDF